MIKRLLNHLLFSSDNPKSKIENPKLVGIAAFVVTFAMCGVAQAQQPKKVARIGYLSSFDPASDSHATEAIRLALRERGYIEGLNIAFEYRYAEGKLDRLPELAVELVHLKVDIILLSGGDRLILAVKNATKTIPIVMVGAGPILSRQASLKALPIPAATSRALQTLVQNSAGSGWSCSKKRFPNLPVSRFSTSRRIRAARSS